MVRFELTDLDSQVSPPFWRVPYCKPRSLLSSSSEGHLPGSCGVGTRTNTVAGARSVPGPPGHLGARAPSSPSCAWAGAPPGPVGVLVAESTACAFHIIWPGNANHFYPACCSAIGDTDVLRPGRQSWLSRCPTWSRTCWACGGLPRVVLTELDSHGTR